MLVLVPDRSTCEMLKIMLNENGKMEDNTHNTSPNIVEKHRG